MGLALALELTQKSEESKHQQRQRRKGVLGLCCHFPPHIWLYPLIGGNSVKTWRLRGARAMSVCFTAPAQSPQMQLLLPGQPPRWRAAHEAVHVACTQAASRQRRMCRQTNLVRLGLELLWQSSDGSIAQLNSHGDPPAPQIMARKHLAGIFFGCLHILYLLLVWPLVLFAQPQSMATTGTRRARKKLACMLSCNSRQKKQEGTGADLWRPLCFKHLHIALVHLSAALCIEAGPSCHVAHRAPEGVRATDGSAGHRLPSSSSGKRLMALDRRQMWSHVAT